jgi:hypothetical protein
LVLGPNFGAQAKVFLVEKWKEVKRWKLSQPGDSAAPFKEFLLLSGALINFLCKNNRKPSCL